MVPDNKLRLLDVGLPTFKLNISYCASGSGHLVLLIARRVPDV